MDKKLFFAVAGGAVLWWYLANKKKAAGLLNIDLSAVGISSSGGFIPNVKLTFKASNPTNTPITVKSILGNVFVNDTQIATVSDFTGFTIPANGSTEFSTIVAPNIAGALSSVTSLLSSGANITFSGTVNAEGLTVPITKTLASL